MDSIFKVGFGIELDTLNGSNEEGLRFGEAFDDPNALIFLPYYDPLWKIMRFFNLGSEAMLKKRKKIHAVDEFVYKLISNKKEQFSRNRDSEKIAREVEAATHAKRSMSIEEFAACATEEALSKMHYLHAVITETVRLYRALPMDGKCCLSDDTLPDGYNVQKGELVVYIPYAMGRMKFIWGDDAEIFSPKALQTVAKGFFCFVSRLRFPSLYPKAQFLSRVITYYAWPEHRARHVFSTPRNKVGTWNNE
ncbi:hypothetical protein ACLOJK_033526 [Asimina triloba]